MGEMLFFDNPNELIDFYIELDIYNIWYIQAGLLNNRGEAIKDKRYVRDLRDIFNDKKLFRRSVSIAEIVSWIDSLTLMVRFFEKLQGEIPNNLFSKIKIRMEYVIEYSKLMRIDYILEYDDNLLLIDFRLVDSFEKIRPTWHKKKLELIIYKELLRNYIKDKNILTYALIVLYEYQRKKPVDKHLKYNINQVQHMVSYFKEFAVNRIKFEW